VSSKESKMNAPAFKSRVSKKTHGDRYLEQKIRTYSRNRLLIRVLLSGFLVLGISYLFYIFLSNRNPGYKELLNSGYKLTGNITASRNGQTVVLLAEKDSVYTLFISKDKGKHFLNSGSWGSTEDVYRLYIAPRDGLVIAIMDSSIHYTKFGQDSVNKLQLTTPINLIEGISFNATNSSMYVYGDNSNIVEVDLVSMHQTPHNINRNYSIQSLEHGNGEWKAIAREKTSGSFFLLEGISLDNMTTTILTQVADTGSKVIKNNANQFRQYDKRKDQLIDTSKMGTDNNIKKY
jgi:hypothetical protein